MGKRRWGNYVNGVNDVVRINASNHTPKSCHHSCRDVAKKFYGIGPWMRRRQGELAARRSGPSVEFLPDPRGTSLFGKKLFFIKFLLSKWSFCSSSSRILQYKDRRCEPTKKPKGQQAYEGKR